MATISENLQTLNESKLAIKTAIENKGIDLTDVPFTEYAEKIDAAPRTLKKFIEIRESVKDLIASSGVWTMENHQALADLLDYNDTENITMFQNAFFKCLFKTAPNLNTSKVTNMYYAFSANPNLETIPLYDFSQVGDMQGCFASCTSLKVIPAFDLRNIWSTNKAFNECTNLTEVWVKNIKTSLQVASDDVYGHLLTIESLVHLIQELRTVTKTQTLTIGTVNLEKIANVYVRTIDITDEMRAEDDLIDEKLPFEVCESTDEGAMLITDYVALKNWSIA